MKQKQTQKQSKLKQSKLKQSKLKQSKAKQCDAKQCDAKQNETKQHKVANQNKIKSNQPNQTKPKQNKSNAKQRKTKRSTSKIEYNIGDEVGFYLPPNDDTVKAMGKRKKHILQYVGPGVIEESLSPNNTSFRIKYKNRHYERNVMHMFNDLVKSARPHIYLEAW